MLLKSSPTKLIFGVMIVDIGGFAIIACLLIVVCVFYWLMYAENQ